MYSDERICTTCSNEMFRYPGQWLCPKCDALKIQQLAKEYVDNILQQQGGAGWY